MSKTNTRVTSGFDRESTAMDVVAGHDLSGRNAIVTGGSSGIGIETARALASAGADVTLAVRDLAGGESVAREINAAIGSERVHAARLDLSSLASVRAFAAAWGERPLSLLINNAGIMACPFSHTEDGFEMQFGTNHLGHFLLAHLLSPALQRGAPSRVVALSSSAHLYSDVHYDDIDYTARAYDPFQAYGQSKTANALFAVEFDRRYRDRGIRAFSVMPGVINTGLARHLNPGDLEKMLAPSADDPRPYFFKNTGQGAATSVWAAVGPELDGHGGLYLENCAEALPFGPDLPRGEGVKSWALDPKSAARLWEISEARVGLAG
ncbi:MAG: SDR family NAD(P)-dependent oxidoreductase [Sphingomonadaceae bacterium]